MTKETTALGCLGTHRGTQAALAAADAASDPSIFSSYRNMFVFACWFSVLSSFIQVCGVVFFLTPEPHLPSVMLFKVPVLATKPLEIFNLRACEGYFVGEVFF